MHPLRATLPACTLLAALLHGCGSDGGAPERERLLVVGWDGATFELIDPLLAAGRLPNLARLVERGASAACRSTVVPISSAAWVGAVTGTTPAHHGVYDFFAPLPGSYAVELVSARSNQAPPLWRILGWHGLQSIVFGVPITWPPETHRRRDGRRHARALRRDLRPPPGVHRRPARARLRARPRHLAREPGAHAGAHDEPARDQARRPDRAPASSATGTSPWSSSSASTCSRTAPTTGASRGPWPSGARSSTGRWASCSRPRGQRPT